MLNKKTEQILDECIKLLRQGKSVSDCLEKYPKTRGLAALLAVAGRGIDVPTKNSPLNRDRIWDKIITHITTHKFTAKNPARSFFAPVFQFAIPRSAFAIVSVVAIIGLLNTTRVAAENSLPGQTLYPVKRTVEKIQLTLTMNEVKKTEVRIQHAEHRLTEAKSIVESKPAADPKVIENTIGELKNATSQVGTESNDNKGLLQKVVELTNKQETVLTDIETKVGGDTKKAVSDALDKAVETKTTAVRNLNQLANTPVDSASNATSTPEIIRPTSTPSINKPAEEKSPQATSTPTTLKKLGSPATTTTEIIIEIITEQPEGAEATTTDIHLK